MIKELIKIANELDSRGLLDEASSLDKIIEEELDASEMSPDTEVEAVNKSGASLTWINREEWESATHSLRKYQIRQMASNTSIFADEESLREGFERDVSSIQNALDREGGSEAGYLVINPWDKATFNKYVIHPRMAHPEGKEIAVPLNTFEREGKRINFFKINDWDNPEGKDLEGEGEEGDMPKGDRFGKVEEEV